MNHHSEISTVDISSSTSRFVVLQGASLFIQTLFSMLPVVFLRETDSWFIIFMISNLSIAGITLLFSKQVSQFGASHFLPFIGVAACTLGIALNFVHPGIMIYIAAWVLLITLGERREYFAPLYLISFLLFTTGCIALCVVFLPNQSFPQMEMALTLTGGISLSLIMIYQIYIEVFKSKSSSNESSQPLIQSLDITLASILESENSIENILWRVSRECIPLLGLEDCVIYLYNESSDKLMQVAAYGNKTPDGSEIIVDPIEIIPGKGVVGECYSSGKPIRIDELNQYDEYIVDDQQRHSELAVPIICRGEVVGVIDSEHSQPSFFTNDHLKAFESLANFCEVKFHHLHKK